MCDSLIGHDRIRILDGSRDNHSPNLNQIRNGITKCFSGSSI